MNTTRGLLLASIALLLVSAAAGAQSPGEVFRKVTASVVLIRQILADDLTATVLRAGKIIGLKGVVP